MGAVRIIGVVRGNGIIGIVGSFGIRILGVRTIRVARFRVMIRVGIAEVGVGIFRIPGLGVGTFGFMVRGFRIPELESELSELESQSEFKLETLETEVTLAYLVLAWGLGQFLTM